MKIHWSRLNDRVYSAVGPDGTPLELHLGADEEGWHLFSSLPEHAGIDYLGEDLHSAMHLTIAMMRATHKVDGWTVDGRDEGNLVWGSSGPSDPVEDEDDNSGGSWWARFLRRAEPAE